MVETYIPQDLNDCLCKLAEKEWIKLAGGTDLMIIYTEWQGASRVFPKPVMFIGNLPELKGCSEDEEFYYIKSCTTHQEVIESKIIPAYIKIVYSQMASPSIRNLATCGGNICNAAAVGDSLPLYYALDASLVLASKTGIRERKISEFIKGKWQTIINQDELLTTIKIPKKNFSDFRYRKLGPRKGNILSKLSVFIVAEIREKKFTDVRISIGALNLSVIRSEEIEKILIGKNLKELEEVLPEVEEEYQLLFEGFDDKRSTKEYREKTAVKLIRNFLISLVKN